MLREEKALLNAIAAEPGEDHHRLAYADWLSENGAPNRAELIRLQCGLERGMDWQNGGEATGDRLEKLKAREEKLIEKLVFPKGNRPGIREFATTPEIATILFQHPARISFKRGMIDELDLSDTSITALPPDLYIGGDLHLNDTPITTLSPGLRVGGNLYIYHIPVTTLPPDLYVGGDLYLFNTPIASLPPGLRVSGSLILLETAITALPPDLYIGGDLDLTNTPIIIDTARSILTMPNLSKRAKISGLETAGFPALAAEARRLPDTHAGPGTPPLP